MRMFFVAFAASSMALTGLSGAAAAQTTTAPTTTVSVDIDMVDIAYRPDTLTVPAGQAIRFTFTNHGEIRHDAFVGGTQAQKRHERKMKADGGTHMDDGHGSSGKRTTAPNAVTVKPGKTKHLSHTFTKTGTTEIGCHEPGHYASGMKIVVTVT